MSGGKRNILEKIADAVTEKLSDLLGALAPQHDAIPVPVRRDEPRRPR
ncbi:hypothetical protein JSE7799_03077 [Jannaschia seosinensis]|uniref:Uncharacterized protein n=1 Tax=Jannaschia seosinensis TaxID=313367 RepID=A0A0M7BG35_9RHOB|nr:hypothetical protein [Jannaschia seosinensis]CUH40345.1 hypothetical protein JSE7799_03077 [Jannaschia seosinensis]